MMNPYWQTKSGVNLNETQDQRDIDDYKRFIAENINGGKKKKWTGGAGASVSDGGAWEREEAAARRREKIAEIERYRGVQRELINGNLNRQKGEAAQRSEENMKQLYVSYMKGLKGMPQQTAAWGAGGAVESLKNRSQLNYENNRAKENQSHATVISALQQKYNDELMALEEKYLSRLMGV
ncbi:MAG: hypothetical protein RR728_06080 [Oscillospiraceae bacterium]